MTREKSKQQFFCESCGAASLRWEGRCGACGAWNTIKEFRPARSGGGKRASGGGVVVQPLLLSEVQPDLPSRRLMGVGSELNRVLGGGLTPGSVVLVAGDPGIGKSTLLMETLAGFSHSWPVLYVSGEESVAQLKQRADRLGVRGDRFPVLMENRLEVVCQVVEEVGPEILVVDSIQTLGSESSPSAAGTVNQVRECAGQLIHLAKTRNMAVFLVGHVTKDGQIAGPRVLEHMVDTVLYFEGERGHDYRILRAVKNRFGPSNEIGVFEMCQSGLKEVANPSELFLSERIRGAAGSVVFPGIEGTRPVLVEIQSLVAPSVFPQPRRNTLGWDPNRLAMLTAVLEKRSGLSFHNHDIFLNIAGGFKVAEPAADLAVAASLFGSLKNLSLDPGLVVVGEIGLGGEVRAVSHVATRLREAAKLGFERALLPEKSMKHVTDAPKMELIAVSSVEAMMRQLP
ncbi:MAG: DNA repair protein RadA [Magnetococcales bacterium]|nr:DNA repair protein RadA [Magnetococcales bacterium]MBF0346765.1 DNA repair protein RadA [Magnetococcales bacterium]MBF0630988.1 DNA repair protein RadA [Magnetococcales bacterium]